MTVQFTMRSGDFSYYDFIDWFNNQKYHEQIRRFQIKKDHDNDGNIIWRFYPHDGVFFFFYKRRLMILSKSTKDAKTMSPPEEITVTVLTFTKDIVFDIFDSIKKVDMNEDGQTDLSVPGILEDGETVSERVTLDSGANTFSFSVANGGDVPYEIAHTESDSVSRPTVSVNGRTIVNEDDTFKGERTYEVGSLRGGENTFTFRSASGDSYVAEIEWSEASSDTTPELYVDGDLACSKSELADGSCEVPQRLLDTGSVIFSFTDGADEFEYSVEQTARAVPTEVAVVVNNDSQSVSRAEAVTVSDDGSWTARRSISGLAVGANTVVVETQNVNGITPNASGRVQYTYEIPQAQNPQIVVTNNGTTENYAVQSSALDANGYLTTDSTVVIPSSEIVAGETTLSVASENGGGMNVQVAYVNETVPLSRVSDSQNETDEG